MKVAVLQFSVGRNKQENLQKVERIFNEKIALAGPLDLIIMPELWTYAFDFQGDIASQIEFYGETLSGDVVSKISEYARKYHVWVSGGSIPLKTGKEKMTNTSILFNRQGELTCTYDKIHLCGWGSETRLFDYGNKVVVTDTEFGIVGSMICYDIRFPELARSMCLSGARIILVNSAFGHHKERPKVELWRNLLRARAIENMVYVIAADQCGEGFDLSYFGHSMIIDPYGNIVSEAEETEEVIFGELDINFVDQARKEIPIYEDRQPDVYQL